MVKSYLGYKPLDCFGLIVSPQSQALYDWTGKFCFSGALEKVIVWNLRNNSMVCALNDPDNKSTVTVIALSPNGREIAVGYEDGKVRVWDWVGIMVTAQSTSEKVKAVAEGTASVLLTGHKSSVTCITWHKSSTKLCSGAADGHIIVWDWIEQRGICRLIGHTGSITQVAFLQAKDHTETLIETDSSGSTSSSSSEFKSHAAIQAKLKEPPVAIISSSKDSLMKIWDLETQHCVQTIVGHRKEVWSFAVNAEETRIYSGSTDDFIRVFVLEAATPEKLVQLTLDQQNINHNLSSSQQQHFLNEADRFNPLINKNINSDLPEELPKFAYQIPVARLLGSVVRQSKDRVAHIMLSPSEKLLSVQSADKTLELFSLFDSQDQARRRRRRISRIKKKNTGKTDEKADGKKSAWDEDNDAADVADYAVGDEISNTKFPLIRAGAKITHSSFCPSKPQILLALNNNSIEIWDLEEDAPAKRSNSLDIAGHSSDVRSTSVSSDNALLLSTSNKTSKVWNLATRNCIRTFESGYGLSCAFVPGNKHVIIGTKEGAIELYDIGSGELIESYKAHKGAIWSIGLRSDNRGIVTGSADKEVQFWDFHLVVEERKDEESGQVRQTRRIGLQHSRSVLMEDDVLAVCISKNQKFLAVSLLDNTVKVFHFDTMRFFLSLYGHKLPVQAIDISTDETLIATGSADKNIKLWGLDFGDCHKSIFAHDDSIMQVRFVPNTHYFFSASKDRTIKYWDGDTWDQIQKFEGHHGEIWSIAMSRDAEVIVSAGHDRSFRLWERTDEQIFIEEEREKHLDRLFENGLEEDSKKYEKESETASTRTVESVQASERLLESLEVAHQELEIHRAFEKDLELYNQSKTEKESGEVSTVDKIFSKIEKPLAPPPNPLLLGKSPSDFLLQAFQTIRANDLDQALMLIPFADIPKLLFFLDDWIKSGKSLELCCRSLFLMLQMYGTHISANHMVIDTIRSLEHNAKQKLRLTKDLMGFNLAALQYLKRDLKQRQEMASFFDLAEKVESVRKRRKISAFEEVEFLH